MVSRQQGNGSLVAAIGRRIPRISTLLLLTLGAFSSGRSFAFPVASGHCSSDYIWAELRTTGTFPKLRGCDPNAVKNALSDSNYRLEIESRHSSNSIAAGLITTQRVQANTVYVVVSTGPDEPGAGQHEPQLGGLIGQIIVGMIQHPPQAHQPPQPPPVVQVQPLPPQPFPEPQPPAAQPAPQPASPPPPPVKITEVTPVAAPVAAEPAPAPQPKPKPKPTLQPKPTPKPTPNPQVSKPPTPTAVAPTPAAPTPAPAPPAAPAIVAPPPPPPPLQPARFSIDDRSKRIKEGDDLELVIRREGSDHKLHRLVLSYSDPSLLASAPTSFEYGADLPDVVSLRLLTKANKRHDGDHDLAVTLVNAEGARVGNPDSVMAVILDQPSWWDKLQLFLASFPAWAVALAAAAVAAMAGLGITRFILPHATCSIGAGRPTLGPMPLRSSWPAIHVDTLLGSASFSIPHPLPTGGEVHAEPSPA